MSQFKSLAQSPSSTSSITTSTPDHKGKLWATPNASSAEMPAELDFLGMRDDELFGNPDDTPDEIQGSLERLESLLWPVEDGPDSLLKLSELPSETATLIDISSHLCFAPHRNAATKPRRPVKVSMGFETCCEYLGTHTSLKVRVLDDLQEVQRSAFLY
ncbi:hypothetical protein A7U60_g740 [Sanghuangporus baumii]|uniref:Uncharacterized protein n=1 Tax=Sanghuangporus baumii TaxID=108892 RepID=A0A9Q5I5N4_SANBA|nr:hypothetical protein A7U60_g740 [Sanghuangporus baumii]